MTECGRGCLDSTDHLVAEAEAEAEADRALHTLHGSCVNERLAMDFTK